jgi:nucleoside transporter
MVSILAGNSKPPLEMGLRIKLSIMMFLEFAVWGAWFSVLGNRLVAMGLSESIGSIFGTMALGTIFAPIIIGQIADRFFASEKLLGLLHLVGGGLLYWLATIPSVSGAEKSVIDATADQFWWIAFAYALVYSPTISLTSSITFTHVPDGQRDFPGIRVLGTIGWIAAGLMVGMGLTMFVDDPKTSNLPFILAAGLSVVLGIFSFLLPNTPPLGKPGDSVPFLKALNLLKDPSFAIFFGVSFIITIVLAFYYGFTGLYLEKHVGVKDVASTMTIGQWSEMLLLPLLPFFLQKIGMKAVLAIGMLAWGLRYAVFSWGGTMAVGDTTFYYPVILSLAFHGICYDFFFAAGFIHVDNESPKEIRGSAQALFVFLTYGVGMWLGNLLSGKLFNQYNDTASGLTDWKTFWLVPSIGVLIGLAIFLVAFRTKAKTTT